MEAIPSWKPRPENEPILPRPVLLWLILAGVILGGTALGVIWWADDAHGEALARTMGMTTFAIANVFFSFTVRDELRSVFDLQTFADKRFRLATGLSALAIVLGTELGILHRILDTVSLTGEQWLVCILAASTIIVASEIQKAVRRRRIAHAQETPVVAGMGALTPAR